MSEIRKSDYKLFNEAHGKDPKNKNSEVAMTRHIYWSHMPIMLYDDSGIHSISLVGYEVPLGSYQGNQKFVDLVGTDRHGYIYLIEAKRKDNTNDLFRDVIPQIYAYEEKLLNSLDSFLFELRQNNDHQDFEYAGIKKLILAPKDYYRRAFRKNPTGIVDGVMLCTFKKSDDYSGLDSITTVDSVIELMPYSEKATET